MGTISHHILGPYLHSRGEDYTGYIDQGRYFGGHLKILLFNYVERINDEMNESW